MSGIFALILRMILAIALYGFLGYALYFLWRETQKQGVALSSRRVPGIHIAIRIFEETIHRHFSQSEITLGRDPGCDISLTEETVSARHARLRYHHAQWWVEDLASTNGVALNDIKLTMPTALASGDEIVIGETRLLINFSPETIVEKTMKVEKPSSIKTRKMKKK